MDQSLDPQRLQLPQNAALVLRFSAVKKQAIPFAFIAATLPTDDTNAMRLVFHKNVAKNLKKIPTHVEGTECTLKFLNPIQCRQIMLALNLMLRLHRRSNAALYTQELALNVYVNKITSVDLTRHAVRRALN